MTGPGTGAADHGARGREAISCFIVCQNEEQQIAACLESVRWCDEIVVVDGGSVDRTLEICRRFTERILLNPWPGYVEQKQLAFAHTSHAWVFNVDADEVVSEELREQILAVLRDPPADVSGYYMRRLVYYLGRWWYRGPFYPGWRLRLVRRDMTVWGGTNPHDKAIVRGRTRRLQGALRHYTYANISDHLSSVNHLTDIAASEGRRGVSMVGLLLRPAWRFGWTYTFAGGFREGFPGFFVCVTAAFYVFLRLAKRVERRMKAAASSA